MDTVRDILADNPGGISRPGILAWARLRIDPAFSEERLTQELAALGPDVVEEYGFLRLAGPSGALVDAESPRAAATEPHEPPSATPATSASPPSGRPASGPIDLSGVVGAAMSAMDAMDSSAWTDATRPDDATAWRASPLIGTGSRDWSAPTTEPAAPDDAPVPWAPVTAATPSAGAIPGWQAPETTHRRSGLIGRLVSALFVAAVIVVNILGGSNSSNSSDGDTQPTPRATLSGVSVAVDDLRVGDCIAVPTADFSELPRIPCTSPHEGEIFFIGPFAGGSAGFPGDADFEHFVETTCHPAFQDYTGTRLDGQDRLEIGWFTPTAEGWSDGDHVVQCYLAMADGSMSSTSLRGSRP